MGNGQLFNGNKKKLDVFHLPTWIMPHDGFLRVCRETRTRLRLKSGIARPAESGDPTHCLPHAQCPMPNFLQL
ncbi:hypothetical protein [Tolypothrix sp. VBCCA 56010]|uniref:hypothetical protein n=1 Tax=Tolypothrix sp. VBCCA 56010 TaxID=3137731 RepID=UPI003D7DAD90